MFTLNITPESITQARDVMRANGASWMLPFLAVFLSALMLLVPEPSTHQLMNVVYMNLILASMYAIGFLSWVFRTPEHARAEIVAWGH